MAGGLPCKAKVYERMRLGQPADQHQDEKAKLLGHGVHRARLATVKSDSLGVPEFSSLSAHRDLSGWLGISTSVKRGHDILLHTKNLHTMSMIDTFSCLCSYACALSQPRATSPYTSTSTGVLSSSHRGTVTQGKAVGRREGTGHGNMHITPFSTHAFLFFFHGKITAF